MTQERPTPQAWTQTINNTRTRLAVDIGGTFTDLVLSLPDRTLSSKLLTTHGAPEEAVIAGTQAILAEAELTGSDLDLVIHGTTLATNALIERKGARTALITTAGFRDSLEIAYEHRFEQYDLYMERPAPLVSRDLRLEVPERMAADGSVLLPLDEAALLRLADVLRAERIEAVAISFLHSYINPVHELRALDLLSAALPDMAFTASCEVCREIREYERTSTTVANAYVLPLMSRYLGRMSEGLADEIITRSRRAMSEAIAALPKGTWSASMRIDGYEAPIDLVAAATIGRDTIHVDFSGSSGMSSYAINCPMCYTEAYTTFGVNCVIAPHIPNNAGTLDAVKATAPEGTIVSATHPAAVYARSVIGHMLPDVVYGCLDQALPDRVPAEGTSNLWTLNLIAGHGLTGIGKAAGTAFMVNSFYSGGAGARPAQDGLSATPFPSGVRNVPVEATEAITPLVIWRKELRQDSGGAGRFRGGLGQVMEVGSRESAPFGIFARFERVCTPRAGARAAALGRPGGFHCPRAPY